MPSSLIASVYLGLLSDPEPTLQIQKRIFAYGVQNKCQDLLTRLTAHRALHPEVDLLLSRVDIAAVKAAWAARPGRSVQELVDLVSTETRSTVIAAFAEREDLPVEVFTAIANKASGQGALLALAKNPAAPQEARETAAIRVAKALPSPGVTYNMEYSRRNDKFTALFATSPELAEPVAAVSKHIPTLFSAASASPLSFETQRRIADLVLVEVNKQLADGHFSHHQYNWVVSLSRALTERGNVGPEACQVLGDVLADLASRCTKAGGWVANAGAEFTRVAAALQTAIGTSTSDFITAVNAAQSAEAIERVITQAQGSMTRHTTGMDTFGLAVVAHPKATDEQVERILGQMSWQAHRNTTKAITDPARMVLVIAARPWLGIDENLVRTTDPQGAFLLLAHKMIERQNSLGEDMLRSRYMTPSIIAKLPLGALVSQEMPGPLASAVSALLVERLGSQEHWSTFESLGSDFKGSIEDLLDVVATV
jgi:hypothetical protein